MKNRFLQAVVCLLVTISLSQANAQKAAGFYDVGVIQQIEIQFKEDNWRYILDSLRYNGDEVLIGNVVLNGQRIENAGVRYRATRAFQPGGNRNGMELILNYTDPNVSYQGISTIELSSALRDPSMVREVLAYEIARHYMPAPRANYARVSVNGKPIGLYVNLESVDAAFAQRNFGESNGPLYRCAVKPEIRAAEGCRSSIFGSLQVDNSADCYRTHYRSIIGYGFDPLLSLAKMLQERPEDIHTVLDVDRTLWMLAFNNALVNLNSYTGQYSSNYFLYRDKSGRFTPVIWETNLCFGSYKNIGIGSDLKPTEVAQLDPLLHANNPERPLIQKLLSNELYRKIYLSHLLAITKDYLTNDLYLTRAKELQKLIRPELAKDPYWFYTIAEFDQSLKTTIGKKSKIPGLAEVMAPRADFLRKHPELTVLPPRISQVTVKKREKLSAIMLSTFKIQAKVEEYPKRVRIFYRFDENEPFREAAMLDDGKSEDEAANDGIFGIDIVPFRGARTIEYYIFAENARMVSYDPPRYMYELHKTSLDEINQ